MLTWWNGKHGRLKICSQYTSSRFKSESEHTGCLLAPYGAKEHRKVLKGALHLTVPIGTAKCLCTIGCERVPIHPLREEGIEPTSSAWKADDVTVYPHPPNHNLFFARVLCIHFWAACKNILEPQKSKVRSPSTHTWENQAGTTFGKVSQDIHLVVR